MRWQEHTAQHRLVCGIRQGQLHGRHRYRDGRTVLEHERKLVFVTAQFLKRGTVHFDRSNVTPRRQHAAPLAAQGLQARPQRRHTRCQIIPLPHRHLRSEQGHGRQKHHGQRCPHPGFAPEGLAPGRAHERQLLHPWFGSIGVVVEALWPGILRRGLLHSHRGRRRDLVGSAARVSGSGTLVSGGSCVAPFLGSVGGTTVSSASATGKEGGRGVERKGAKARSEPWATTPVEAPPAAAQMPLAPHRSPCLAQAIHTPPRIGQAIRWRATRSRRHPLLPEAA